MYCWFRWFPFESVSVKECERVWKSVEWNATEILNGPCVQPHIKEEAESLWLSGSQDESDLDPWLDPLSPVHQEMGKWFFKDCFGWLRLQSTLSLQPSAPTTHSDWLPGLKKMTHKYFQFGHFLHLEVRLQIPLILFGKPNSTFLKSAYYC